MARSPTFIVRTPIITGSVLVVALIAYIWPSLSDCLVYDHQAILKGQLWRLLTAPFVHFSFSHIFWDSLVFGAAGWIIERSGYSKFWVVCILASIFPSLFYLLASPELERYGGLSGLATGAAVYLCLCSTWKKDKNRIIWMAMLGLMGLKIMVEAALDSPIFVSTNDIEFHNLPSVHAFGYLGAMIVWIWTQLQNRLRLKQHSFRLKCSSD